MGEWNLELYKSERQISLGTITTDIFPYWGLVEARGVNNSWPTSCPSWSAEISWNLCKKRGWLEIQQGSHMESRGRKKHSHGDSTVCETCRGLWHLLALILCVQFCAHRRANNTLPWPAQHAEKCLPVVSAALLLTLYGFGCRSYSDGALGSACSTTSWLGQEQLTWQNKRV